MRFRIVEENSDMQDKPLPPLRHDCAACSALCCVMLPFDADQGFGFDKEAGTPCRHLQPDFMCGIHDKLQEQGFRGCTHYSCYGAGQRVTRLFGETHWRSNPERSGEIHAAFVRMHKLHELQFLLQTALGKAVASSLRQRLQERQQQLEALCIEVESHNAVDLAAATADTYVLLRQLATEPAIVALRKASIPEEQQNDRRNDQHTDHHTDQQKDQLREQ